MSVCAAMLFGCETWSLCATNVKRLSVFDHGYFSHIVHVQLKQHLSNVEVPERFFGAAVIVIECFFAIVRPPFAHEGIAHLKTSVIHRS